MFALPFSLSSKRHPDSSRSLFIFIRAFASFVLGIDYLIKNQKIGKIEKSQILVDPGRIEPPPLECESSVLPLNYGPFYYFLGITRLDAVPLAPVPLRS